MYEKKIATQTCDWIEGGLAFAPRSVHACCVLHHENRGWPKLFDFKGERLKPELLIKARKNLLASIQNKENNHCLNCPLLRSSTNSDHETAIVRKINLSHFTTCNLRCSYCYLQKDKLSTDWWNDEKQISLGHNPLDLMTVFHFLVKDGLLDPEAEIFWGGGEPTIMPGFTKMLNFFSRYGCNITLTTNGTIYSPAIAELKNQKMTIICSVDAGTSKTYKNLKGLDRYIDVWKNLKRYIDADKNVIAKYILVNGNENEEEVIKFLDTAADIGIKNVIIDIDAFNLTINAKRKKLINSAIDHGKKIKLSCHVDGCGAININNN